MPLSTKNISPELLKKYPHHKILEAIEYLSYKVDVKPMPKAESNTESTLYIFRHGQTYDNKDYIFSGWRDSELTEKGKLQAQILADKLENKKLDFLISSPQKRAVETMRIAVSRNEKAKNLEIHLDERIKERSYGILQGRNKLEIQLEDPDKLHKIRRSFKYHVEEGESVEMVCARVAEFCNDLVPLMKDKNMNVAISCHGNSIRGFRRYFEGLDDDTTATIETPLAQDYLAYIIK